MLLVYTEDDGSFIGFMDPYTAVNKNDVKAHFLKPHV